jgi:hypothetical protein
VRQLFAAHELGEDKLFGHIKPRKNRARFLEFCRYLRTLYPPQIRIAIICDNYSPHLTTRKDKRVGQWAAAGPKRQTEATPNMVGAEKLSCADCSGTALGDASHDAFS